MTPAAHIAVVCTLLVIFGAFAIGNIVETPRNRRRAMWRRLIRANRILK